MEVILGLDTSCYTTSLALVDTSGNLLWEKRIILDVPLGKRGLAQSEGVFQHGRNLPLLFSALKEILEGKKIIAIAASTKPRPYQESYMPVFTVGEGYGKALAVVLNVPFFAVSHQEGHLQAGLWSAQANLTTPFLAVHLSGGTTELLLVEKGKDSIYQLEILGGSLDLHAGQLIDRIGVALGLSFPAGKEFDLLSQKSQITDSPIPSSVSGYNINFSGAETKGLKLISQGTKKEDVALAVLKCVANSLEKIIRQAVEQYKISNVLLVGGVAANSYLRHRVSYRLEHPAVGAKLFFAKPEYSGDNAVGPALLALQFL